MNHTMTAAVNGASGRGLQQVSESKIPTWLAYLVAAYPSAKNSPMTYVVLTDQFQGTPGAELYEAARLYVKEGGKWFPSAFEFRPFVERATAQAEEQAAAARWQSVVDTWPGWRVRRTQMLRDWHKGVIGDSDLAAFCDELQGHGLLHAAANLRARLLPVRATSVC